MKHYKPLTNKYPYDQAVGQVHALTRIGFQTNDPDIAPWVVGGNTFAVLADLAALTKLLVEKEVFTQEELETYLETEMNREYTRLKNRLELKGMKVDDEPTQV